MVSAVEAKFLAQNKNLVKEIIPLQGLWDSNIPTPANATDGDLYTKTGFGSKVTTASGSYGYLIYDLGAIKTFNINLKVSQYFSTGGGAVYIKTADESGMNTNINQITVATVATLTSEGTYYYNQRLKGRYIQILFTANQACTAYGQVYDLMVQQTP